MKIKFFIKIIFASALLWFLGCQKEHVNPYDTIDQPEPTGDTLFQLEPTSIEGLHANIFKPTCANSGCHDGTFEPDFRTIESSYNTLVHHPIIKNDPQGTYEVRVLPSNLDQSQLIARLTFDIDGNSGIMPLAVDPGSDWDTNKDTYIQNIKDWISAGAKDIFGNSPTQGNGLPYMVGVAANDGTWVSREGNNQGTLRVPQSVSSLDIYIALQDDDTPPENLTNNQIKFSNKVNDFENEPPLTLQVLGTPIQQIGFGGTMVNYYHKVTINPATYATLEQPAYFRVYVKDSSNPITEIPSDGAALYIKNYFSFSIIQ